MNQNEAIHKAKEILSHKSIIELKNESWTKLSNNPLSNNWEMNVWQEEETGKYRSAVFPIDEEGDISGKGIDVYSKEMILENKRYNGSYEYTLNTGEKVVLDFVNYTGVDVLNICFHENDIFNHLILFLQELPEPQVLGENVE